MSGINPWFNRISSQETVLLVVKVETGHHKVNIVRPALPSEGCIVRVWLT